MIESIVAEWQHAIRTARRSPGFSLVAILTLALGIGVSTALFSVVYGLLLRPLDYRDADRLVAFQVDRAFAGRADRVAANFSLADLEVWRARARSFDSLAMFSNEASLLTTGAGSDVITTSIVTPTFFETASGRMRLGRGLGPGDDSSPAAVISAQLWHRAFGGDPTVIGRQVTLDRQPYVVVGVADTTFQLPSPRTDLWRPVGFARTLNPQLASPRANGFQLLARLRVDVSLIQARADAETVARAIDPALRAIAIPLRDSFLAPSVRPTLLVLLAAVGLVLLVTCANVTNLLLARNTARSREHAIRLALGASRHRPVAQAIAYSAVIAGSGAIAGGILAAGIVRGLVALEPAAIPRLDAVRVDYPVLLFIALAASLTTVLVALLPALQSSRIGAALGGRGIGVAGGRGVVQVRRALVAVQMAVAAVLLVGASLLGRSFVQLLRTDIGVTSDHVTAALVDVSFGRELSMGAQRALVERVVERLATIPGVTSIGAGASMPPNRARLRFTMDRFDDASGQKADYMVDAVTATPGYFTTLGIRVRSGRPFGLEDAPNGRQTMIVSASTARQLFGNRDPIGRVVQLPTLTSAGMSTASVAVVGVVDDVKYSGIETPANAVIYRPFAQQPWSSMYITVRTIDTTPGFASLLRREIAAVDSDIGILEIDTLDSLVSGAVAQPRFRAVVLTALAAVTIALAGVGLSGVVAYAVAQRTAEIGVRMALGARRADVIRLVLREGLVVASIGVTAGTVAALALSDVVAHLLYGIPPTDPASFAGGAVFLLVVATAASYLPARRASRIDPLVALRHE
jgi:predicted permease